MTPCESIGAQIGELFICSEANGFTRVRTPFLYPDGDVMDLFTRSDDGGIFITDLGESSRWLRSQGTSQKRSLRQSALISDIASTHGVEFRKGMLQIRVQNTNDWAKAFLKISEAAIRVADLWTTFRGGRPFTTATDDIADFLNLQSIPFERSIPITGFSGETWIMDFVTHKSHEVLVKVLSSGSRGTAVSIRDHTVALWADLNNQKSSGKTLISLFDDSTDVWGDADIKMIERFSEVVTWSRPEEFLKKIS